MEQDKMLIRPPEEASFWQVRAGVSRRRFGKSALAATAGFLSMRDPFPLGQEPASSFAPFAAKNVLSAAARHANGHSSRNRNVQAESGGL